MASEKNIIKITAEIVSHTSLFLTDARTVRYRCFRAS